MNTKTKYWDYLKCNMFTICKVVMVHHTLLYLQEVHDTHETNVIMILWDNKRISPKTIKTVERIIFLFLFPHFLYLICSYLTSWSIWLKPPYLDKIDMNTSDLTGVISTDLLIVVTHIFTYVFSNQIFNGILEKGLLILKCRF